MPCCEQADMMTTTFFMVIPTEESLVVKSNKWWAKLNKVIDLLLLTEPFWVSAAAAFVYLSVISDWACFTPWLCLAFAFIPFLLRLVRYGHLSRLTPFDIPILVLLGGMIVGVVVSKESEISLEAFQTFLAATAFYYCMVNFSKPSWLLKVGLSLAAVGGAIAMAYAATWYSSDTQVPHGLGIALVVIGVIALGIAVFSRGLILRSVSVLFGLALLGLAIYFTNESVHRLITLDSIESRMRLWLDVITPIEGSSLWAGLGLGCWSLTDTAPYGHVHNAYLELYINTGAIGVVGFIGFLAAGNKLAFDIIYSGRDSLYYGFGIGVILAILAVLAISFVESAAFGFGAFYGDSYHYILTPIPFILAGSLGLARRLLREEQFTAESAEDA